jgi:hypothetical protein
MPPDLSKPYDTEQDRATDRENLITYWVALKPLIDLADMPAGEWPERARDLLASFASHSRNKDPAARLRRWASLYAEELGLIEDVRDRIGRAGIVTDPELLGATWLARQVLATLADIDPSEIDPAWVRTVAGQAG